MSDVSQAGRKRYGLILDQQGQRQLVLVLDQTGQRVECFRHWNATTGEVHADGEWLPDVVGLRPVAGFREAVRGLWPGLPMVEFKASDNSAETVDGLICERERKRQRDMLPVPRAGQVIQGKALDVTPQAARDAPQGGAQRRLIRRRG